MRLAAPILLIVVIVLLARPQFREQESLYLYAEHQLDSLRAAEWLHNNVDETTRVAAFNAGVIGYYSDRLVLNLDGVINNQAFDAVRDRALFCYLQDASVAYYLDYDPLMREIYEHFWGAERCPLSLVKVDEIDPANPEAESRITIFRVE
jgi:hypothetical protein